MFHYHMTREQIGKSSLAFIKAVNEVLARRIAESLGLPYPDDDNEESSDDDEYPLYKAENVERYGEYKGNPSKSKQPKPDGETVFDATKMGDIMRFFSGLGG